MKTIYQYCLFQWVFWGGYCLINLLLISAYGFFSSPALVISVALSLLLAAVSHGLRQIYRGYDQNLSLGRLFLHLLWLIPIAAIATQTLLHGLIYLAVILAPSATQGVQEVTPGSFFSYSINTAIMLLLWSIVYLLRKQFSQRRQAEIERWQLQAKMTERELDFLRSQINSHFLFNAINNLRALIREDAEGARKGLADLSTLLRGILHSDSKSLVKLREELEWVRGYLSLEALQFEQRLQASESIEEDLLNNPIPPLLLQTLVENAVKHGIAARRQGGCINITAAKISDGEWALVVTNPLPEATTSHAGNGIGLANARERLLLAFGDKARLDLIIDTDIRAQIILPL